MAKRRKKQRRSRDALVRNHLENVSKKLFEDHPDIVREFIGHNAGIYALYKKSKLYYVGLTSGLRGRLRSHGKNRHGKAWDRFSIYLTINDHQLREIEALLLRIAQPPGAKQRGKFSVSRDMRRWMAKAIRNKQTSEVSTLFGGIQAKEQSGENYRADQLRRLFPQGARLKGTLRNKTFRGRIRANGKVRYKGKTFNSLSTAATAALGRNSDGWTFWHVERARGNWVKAKVIRSAGTPLYLR